MRNSPLKSFAKISPLKADVTEKVTSKTATTAATQAVQKTGARALAAGLSKAATLYGIGAHLYSAYKEGKKVGFKHSTNVGQFQKNVKESQKKGWASHKKNR